MKSALAHLLLVIAGIAVGLLGVELAVRIILPAPPIAEIALRHVPAALRASKPVHVPGASETLYVKTPTGRRLRPNLSAVIENQQQCRCRVEIRSNALGFRGPEIGAKRRTRVLFLGDSITMADYANEAQTWVRRVEQLSLGGPVPVEAINAGVPGIGLANEVAILLEKGLSTEPDAVVLGWYLNDAKASRGMRLFQPPPALRVSRLAQHLWRGLSSLRGRRQQPGSKVGPIGWELWRRDAYANFPRDEAHPRGGFNASIHSNFGDWGSAWSEGAWRHMRPYFEELKRLSEVHDFELLFVAFPNRNQVRTPLLHDYPQQRLAKVAADLDVPLLDLLPPLRAAVRALAEELGRAADGSFFYDRCHYTPLGSEEIAQWIHGFLQRELGGDA